ncbi:MAG: efflux transporter periplasmic adaptor subunit [Gammaproteobacteria bacterium HGW-Gammaproteobacteria-4]|jgi:RND family efflux transporter MFP subunit|nr:MAG: efflux transporter periplasmic adaptor subunit [Gammaproteobacteria bacterium HGW-Gammaproteobacteria-4]
MKSLPLQRRTLAVLGIVVPLLALLVYVALRSGPLAPVAVTVATVQSQALSPALFGIGTVDARYTYRIGPTVAGRLQRLDVDVGDRVMAGQVLGEMDPVDLDERIRSQESALQRAQAAQREADARQTFASAQAVRYRQLVAARLISEEVAAARQQELQIADAVVSAAREDVGRARADREALLAQRGNLRLIAPVDGVVALRHADPGTTVVAGQAVIDVIEPGRLWITVRFDQIRATGLAVGLPARIALRSRSGQVLNGRVVRVEPMADAVTEETLAKVAFDRQLEPMPPIGELAEVTVDLPALAAAPTIPNAAIRREGNRLGVWQIIDGALRFAPVTLGREDLDGQVQVREGLNVGDQVVVFSERSLTARSAIHVVERIAGGSP